MKDKIIGLMVLIVVLLCGFAASASYLGEGLVGHLLIGILCCAAVAYSLSWLLRCKRIDKERGYLVVTVLGIFGYIITLLVMVLLPIPANSPVYLRIGSMLLSYATVLFVIGAKYSVWPYIKLMIAAYKDSVAEDNFQPV